MRRICFAAFAAMVLSSPAVAFPFPADDALFPVWEKLCRVGAADMVPDCQTLILKAYASGSHTDEVACDFRKFWKQVDADRALLNFAAASRWPEAVTAFADTPGVCWVKS